MPGIEGRIVFSSTEIKMLIIADLKKKGITAAPSEVWLGLVAAGKPDVIATVSCNGTPFKWEESEK